MRKSTSGKGSRRGFDSVPADDGFRHYMSRKIELQRKQFGLMLPPPPPQESPPENSILSKNDHAKTNGSCSDDRSQLGSSTSPSPRKSVRFHSELERIFVPTSVSEVLENLKQKHTKKSSLRRRRYGKSSSKRNDGESYSSVQGVLDGLQRRHDKSFKRKRPESVLETLTDNEPVHSFDDGTATLPNPSGVNDLDFWDQGETDQLISKSTAHHEQHQKSPWSSSTMPLTQIDPSSPDTDMDTFNIERGKPEASDGLQYTDKAKCGVNFQQQPSELVRELDLHTEQHEVIFVRSPPPSSTDTLASCTDDGEANPSRVHKPRRPDLFFSGIVVLVNGHTDPDATTLMRLLHKHGGDLEKYETHRVTHIIAERLSSAKANIYKKQQKPTPVCRPEWITESVKKGQLLPFGDYLLQDVMEAKAPGTKSLKYFFGAGASTTTETSEPETNRWADTDPSKCKYHLNGRVRTVGNDPTFLES